jgi:hypothetical protein
MEVQNPVWEVNNVNSAVTVQDDKGQWQLTARSAEVATSVVYDHNLLERSTNETTETAMEKTTNVIPLVKRPLIHWK